MDAFKSGFLGCFGVLAAVVVVILLASVCGSVAFFGAAKGGKDVHAALELGGSGTVKTTGGIEMSVTINEIVDPAVSANPGERPPASHRYVKITVTMENVGDHQALGGLFTLRTKDGFEHQQEFIPGLGATDFEALRGLTPGAKARTVLAFKVPAAARLEWLRYDPNLLAKGDLYFDAK